MTFGNKEEVEWMEQGTANTSYKFTEDDRRTVVRVEITQKDFPPQMWTHLNELYEKAEKMKTMQKQQGKGAKPKEKAKEGTLTNKLKTG